MFDTLRDVARRAAAIVGAAMNVGGIVLFLAPLDVRADYVGAAVVATGTAAMWFALRDRDGQIKAKDQVLDDRERAKAALKEAQKEFHDRLYEGTEVLRGILPWKPFIGLPLGERKFMEAERIAAYTKLVADWNEACIATVGIYLDHRKWVMQLPVEYSPSAPSPVPRKVVRLREEVREKIKRLDGLQQELQSSKATTS